MSSKHVGFVGASVGLALDGVADGLELGDSVSAHVLSARHTPLTQSLGPFMHCSPKRHFKQIPPPQSVCVSSPFCTLSVQLLAVGEVVGEVLGAKDG